MSDMFKRGETAGRFHKVWVKNDWDRLSFFVDGNELTSEVRKATVRWRSGESTTETIHWITEDRVGFDHGKSYTVTNRVPYVTGPVRGFLTSVLLTALEVGVDE